MPSLRRKRPSTSEPISEPTDVLPAGADHADWVTPVERIIVGAVMYEPWVFIHRTDPIVARAPHLFRRCSDNRPVGPPPQTSGPI